MSRNKFIELVDAKNKRANPPEFHVGDTINLHLNIREGDKQRVQVFNGVVISRKGAGTGETFTVRRIVANEGVERIFLLHSPSIVKIDVVRSGKVRRAKLYFLRDRVGKSRRLREKRVRHARGTTQASDDSPASIDPVETGEEERELAGVPS
jgi:large subunit ribosomal protein L19